MATETARTSNQFPPQSSGATIGPLVETVRFSDGTSTVSITPGDDGAVGPGVSTSSADPSVTVTVNPAAAPVAPAAQAQASPLADDGAALSFTVAAPKV